MSFLRDDSYWVDTANFVQEHLQSGERLIAPIEFSEIFPGKICPYSLLFMEEIIPQWVVIHKGMIAEIDYIFLRELKNDFNLVFANEIFIVFSKNKAIVELPFDHPHVQYFVEKIKMYNNFRTLLLSLIKSAKTKIVQFLLKKITNLTWRMKSDSIRSEQLLNNFSNRNAIYLGSHKVLTRTIWGHKIFVDSRDISLSPHIILDGYWEMQITNAFMKIIKEKMCVVEIGANIGYYTIIAASKVGIEGKVHAFEANPKIFEILFQNIAVNGFGNIVNLINKAVVNKSGKIDFHRLQQFLGGSSIHEFSEETLNQLMETAETIEVDTISLDEYFADKDMRVDMLKIDAEGSEPLIFSGMKKTLRSNPQIMIICEFSPRMLSGSGVNPRVFLEEIMSYGFKLKNIDLSSNIVDASMDELLNPSSHYELFLTR